jgi:hypothetical protein
MLGLVTPIGMFKPKAVAQEFPVIETTNTTNITSNSASWTVNLPASIAAGNLLLCHLACIQDITYTLPAGWQMLCYDRNQSSATFFKRATGSEGSTMTVGLSSATIGCALTHRISKAHATLAPYAIMGATVGSTTPNPPNGVPYWAQSSKVLWLAVTERNNIAAPTGWPTNYTLNQIAAHNNSVIALHAAGRQLEATTEDPGTFTYAASANNTPWTIAIPPTYIDASALGPYIISALPSGNQNDSDPVPVSIPAGVEAGDLLIVGFAGHRGGRWYLAPAGWSTLCLMQDSYMCYRFADGTEGGTTINFNQTSGGTNNRPSSYCLRIGNAHSYAPPEAQGTWTSGITGPNPPSITPSWGSAKSLIIAAAYRNTGSAVTSGPSGYDKAVVQDFGGSGDASVAVYSKSINAASEDPGAFTYPGTASGMVVTIAIPPKTITAGLCASVNAQTAPTANVNPQPVRMPQGIVNGDRVIVLIEAVVGQTITTPSGWTQIYQTTTNITNYAAYRNCDGTEGATVNFTLSTATSGISVLAVKIKGHDAAQAPEAGTNAASATTTVDPPAITPSWGSSKKSLFITAYSRSGGPNAITAYPSGYFNALGMYSESNGNTRNLATAIRTATVASEDPGVFTLSGSNNTNCNTIAVKAA